MLSSASIVARRAATAGPRIAQRSAVAAATTCPVDSARALHTSHAASYKAPLNDVKFLINDVYVQLLARCQLQLLGIRKAHACVRGVRRNQLQEHYKKLDKTGGADASADTVEFILEEMARFCESELAPLNVVGDDVGCKSVHPPPPVACCTMCNAGAGAAGMLMPTL